MIAFVAGRVAAILADSVVVEVGGFGLQVYCAPTAISRVRVGEPARFATSLVVREDSLTLYGFADDDERMVFELLQTATGVGPRLAQAMLGVHPPAALRRAVATDDFATLSLVPGIGRKTAQRIVLELKDKLAGATLTEDVVVLPAAAAQAGARASTVRCSVSAIPFVRRTTRCWRSPATLTPWWWRVTLRTSQCCCDRLCAHSAGPGYDGPVARAGARRRA